MSHILQNIVLRAAAAAGRSSGYVTKAPRSFISTNVNKPLRCSNKSGTVEKVTPPPPAPGADGAASLRNAYRPNRFEQRMLVWTKKYKSLAEVPTHVKWVEFGW